MKGARVWILGAVAVAGLFLGLPAAHAQRPEWKQQYLKGLELENQERYRPAAQHFAAAEALHPRAEKDVDFGDAGRLDYDPYYHGARCLALAGGSLAIVRRLSRKSDNAGVTPRATLEALREEILHRRGGLDDRASPPFWKNTQPLRPPRNGPPRERRPPGERATARSAESPVPTKPQPSPSPTSTPRPALAAIDLGELPAGVVVSVDGRGYPAGTRRILVRPGRHSVDVAQGSSLILRTSVELQAGDVLRPVVPAAPEGGIPTATPSPSPTADPTPTASPKGVAPPAAPYSRVLLLLLGVLVLAGVLLAVVLRRRHTPDDALEMTPTRRMTPVESLSAPRGFSPRTAMAGRTFGRYVVEDRLGSGGMATTYLARRLADGREVALKVPHEHCLDDESFRRRFVREGRLGAQLHHPNIVRILEAGEEGATPYLAMELVRGTTLRDQLRTAGELPLDTALDLARQIAEALDYAHSKGVIHRDLKPENLMILPDGRLVVMDFGIARVEGGAGLTATSVFVGTPAYAAPEAIAGEVVDHRLDLYALGILLLEMLEGGLPFAGASPLEQLQRHLEGRLPERGELNRHIPDDVWELITGLTARDRDERFPAAEAFLVALRDVLRRRELKQSPSA